ncbi:MAG: alpha/beta hydrolase [Candidatus Sericytochromatia bacterium]
MNAVSLWSKKARTVVKKSQHTAHWLGLQWADRVAPEKAAATAEALFLTPRRYHRPLGEAHMLAQAQQGELLFKGQMLRTWQWGEGPLVVLAHGWAGRGSQFQHWVESLRRSGYGVLCFDAPGHGDSEGSQTSLAEFVEVITELQRLHGPFAALIGHSLGGAAAVLAALQGVSVGKIVTLGAPSDLQDMLQRTFYGRMGLSHGVVKRVIRRIEKRFDVDVADLQVKTRVTELKQPLLVVHDLDDKEISWNEGEILARRAPQGQLLTTKGWGHYRLLNNAQVIAQVQAFLDDQPLPTLDSPDMALLLAKA